MNLYGYQLLSEQYIILPAATASIITLIVVSLSTPKDPKSKYERFYTKDASLAKALEEVKKSEEQ